MVEETLPWIWSSWLMMTLVLPYTVYTVWLAAPGRTTKCNGLCLMILRLSSLWFFVRCLTRLWLKRHTLCGISSTAYHPNLLVTSLCKCLQILWAFILKHSPFLPLHLMSSPENTTQEQDKTRLSQLTTAQDWRSRVDPWWNHTNDSLPRPGNSFQCHQAGDHVDTTYGAASDRQEKAHDSP